MYDNDGASLACLLWYHNAPVVALPPPSADAGPLLLCAWIPTSGECSALADVACYTSLACSVPDASAFESHDTALLAEGRQIL
jgi:hypothetical protein